MVDLTSSSVDELTAMAAAGAEITQCYRVLSKSGDNVVGDVLRDGGVFYELNHYPAGDVYDWDSHSQYYYHSHRKGEHGHFHTYLRSKGMPTWIKPAPAPDFIPPEDDSGALSHIVAISMDSHGYPIGLFTTNRWVCGDTWYKAEGVSALIDLFKIDHARPSWPVNRWITAMLTLFKPQIIELLWERDETVATWQQKHPRRNVFEDRDLDITSECRISVEEQIRQINAALRFVEANRSRVCAPQSKRPRRGKSWLSEVVSPPTE
ncbi:MAG: hypothetical protein L0154_25885 [Chloroflexi bacterium]|nr:hypothetical protein [Chloroflexota bacterium]